MLYLESYKKDLQKNSKDWKVEMLKKINDNILKIVLISFFIIMLFIILNGIFDYEKVVYKYNPIYLTIGILAYIFLIKYVYKVIIPKVQNNKVIVYVLFSIFTIGCILSRIIF